MRKTALRGGGETIEFLALYDGLPRDFEEELGPLILETAALVPRLEEHSEEAVCRVIHRFRLGRLGASGDWKWRRESQDERSHGG